MPDSLPFRTCPCGSLALFGVTAWTGPRAKDGLRQPLFENYRLPSVSHPIQTRHRNVKRFINRRINLFDRFSSSGSMFRRCQFRRMRSSSSCGSDDTRHHVYRRNVLRFPLKSHRHRFKLCRHVDGID